jgi:hypothetical protein
MPTMTVFTEIESLYLEIDCQYETQEFQARQNNLTDKETELSCKRELNDHAYYLFLFTRFEGFVREKSSDLISTKQSLPDWEQCRVWNILPKDKNADGGINFLNRVALLLENGRDSHYFGKIRDYYDLRNKLAHGGNFDSPISIETVVTDFNIFITHFKL